MDKQIITFSANEQTLRKTGGLDIYASKTVSYIEAHFDLGQNWSGYDSIEAVWWNDYVRPVRTVLDTEGVCIVPPEVLTKKGEVYVNLVGVISSGNTLTDRLTTHPITALTNKFNAQLGEGTTAPLTPSEYEQFVATVKADADRAEDAKDSARGYAESASASASSASASASNASTSETNAHTSEVNAKASELNAETYKDQAQTYAQNADISATNAENAKDEAIDARDEILGMSATATTLPAGSDATASYSDGVLTLGIPKGVKGDRGQQGIQGETGATPNFTIGTVETLEPTEDATATITGTAENPILNLGIPQGEVGEVSYADLKSLLPMDTASGSIVSIADGQSVIPVDSLKVSLEPIQDLHGYDKPWIGGNGKNKVNPDTIEIGYYTDSGQHSLSNDYRTSTLILAKPNTAYSTSVFAKDTKVRVGGLVATCWDADENIISQYTTSPFTTPSNTAYIRVRNFQAATSYITSDNFIYQLEEGSVYTDYSPYSNICPISGRTEVDTHRTGVNVWDEEWEVGNIDVTTGLPYSDNSRIRSKNFTRCLPNTTYYFTFPASKHTSTGDLYFVYYDENKNHLGDISGWSVTSPITTPANAFYFKFKTSATYGNTYNNDISINYPSTDHEYHAYEGNTYTTALGRTVYGGSVDLVSGVLTVTMASVDLGTLNWNAVATGTSGVYRMRTQGINTVIKPTSSASEVANIVCSQYKASNNNATYDCENGTVNVSTNGAVIVYDANYNTSASATAFKTVMNGVQLVYELATPTTVQLTPTEVKLLLGDNNVWSDGDVAIVYSADVTKWIEKQLS